MFSEGLADFCCAATIAMFALHVLTFDARGDFWQTW